MKYLFLMMNSYCHEKHNSLMFQFKFEAVELMGLFFQAVSLKTMFISLALAFQCSFSQC